MRKLAKSTYTLQSFVFGQYLTKDLNLKAQSDTSHRRLASKISYIPNKKHVVLDNVLLQLPFDNM